MIDTIDNVIIDTIDTIDKTSFLSIVVSQLN